MPFILHGSTALFPFCYCHATINGMAATKYVAGFTYTDAELLALWRECLARISVSGQSYKMQLPGGGTQEYTSADLADVQALVNEYQAKVNAASSPIFATLYARMRRAF